MKCGHFAIAFAALLQVATCLDMSGGHATTGDKFAAEQRLDNEDTIYNSLLTQLVTHPEEIEEEKRYLRFGKGGSSAGRSSEHDKTKTAQKHLRFGRGSSSDVVEDQEVEGTIKLISRGGSSYPRWGRNGGHQQSRGKWAKRYLRFGRRQDQAEKEQSEEETEKRYLRFGKKDQNSFTVGDNSFTDSDVGLEDIPRPGKLNKVSKEPLEEAITVAGERATRMKRELRLDSVVSGYRLGGYQLPEASADRGYPEASERIFGSESFQDDPRLDGLAMTNLADSDIMPALDNPTDYPMRQIVRDLPDYGHVVQRRQYLRFGRSADHY